MTRAQYEREKIFRLQREAEAARQRELQLLAQGQADADPRYVADVVKWIWSNVLERKVAKRDSLPPIEQKRISTLVELVA